MPLGEGGCEGVAQLDNEAVVREVEEMPPLGLSAPLAVVKIERGDRAVTVCVGVMDALFEVTPEVEGQATAVCEAQALPLRVPLPE